MRYELNVEAEPFAGYPAFSEESETLDTEREVDRSSREYLRWVQQSVNQVLGLRLAVDGVAGTQTRSAIRSFQRRSRLRADGIVGPRTEAALIGAGASPPPGGGAAPAMGPPPTAPRHVPTPPAQAGAVDWTQVPQNNRIVYVMQRLIHGYGFPENGAAGLVGNLWAESGLLPNRIEGSASNTPMRARDFDGRVRNFTAEQVMNRNSQRRQGPRLPGIGLAQWTTPGRRMGLFRHSYRGRQLRAAVLFDMDAQIDYLVTELRSSYRSVYNFLMRPNVTAEAASDEVLYSFETPAAILGPRDPTSGRRPRLPRSDPRVEEVFGRRRTYASQAFNLYRHAA